MMNGGGGGKEEMLQTFQTKIGQNMDFDLPPYQEHDELAKTFPDEQFHEEVHSFSRKNFVKLISRKKLHFKK